MKFEFFAFGKRVSRLVRLLLLCSLPIVSACAYFNTFYNAKKFFAQAEKARQQHQQEAFLQGLNEKPPLNPQTRQLYQKSAESASRVLEKHAESRLVDDAMFLMGKAFYWQADYQSAVRSFEELEENFPESQYYHRARYWRGLSYEGLWMADQARPLYRELVAAGEREIAAQAGLRLAELAFDRGDYASAIQESRATLEAVPAGRRRAALWLRLGEALVALEDATLHDQALDAFTQVMREKPALELEYQARLNIGRLRYAQGDAEGALQVYRRLLGENRFRPFEGQTRILVGQYYQDRRLPERALAEYLQVRDDFSQTASSAMALYHTGLLHLREYGDSKRAIEYFQDARRERSGSEAARLAGEMMGYLGRLEQYKTQIRQADSLAVEKEAPLSVDGLPLQDDETLLASPELDDETGMVEAPDSPAVHDSGMVGRHREDSELTAAHQPAMAPNAQGQLELLAEQPDRGKAEVLEKLLAVAELYRDPQRIAVPDSAIRYYREVIDRFPEFESLARIFYSIAWIYEEMLGDSAAARPYWERLLKEYPATAHANAARRLLGLEAQSTDEEQAARQFEQIESLREERAEALETYVPLLDSLRVRFPHTQTAARAAYVAAFSYENVRGDSLEAARRYQQLYADFPRSRYAALVAARDSVQREGAILRLERSLKLMGGEPRPGEQISLLALEPDSLDAAALARKYAGFGMRAQRRSAWRQARRYYESSIEQQLEQPEVLYRLGNTLREEGYLEDARRFYRQALSFEPEKIEVQYRLFKEHLADGQLDSANYYLRRIVAQDRSNPQVEALREQYPRLTDSRQAEELELRTLNTLELDVPEDELEIFWQDEMRELPVVREAVLPAFPVGSEDSTSVVLDLLVDEKGLVETVEVFAGEQNFRAAAVAAARNYRFFPAVGRDGKEKKVWVELVLPFQPSGVGADAEREPPSNPEVGQSGRDSASIPID